MELCIAFSPFFLPPKKTKEDLTFSCILGGQTLFGIVSYFYQAKKKQRIRASKSLVILVISFYYICLPTVKKLHSALKSLLEKLIFLHSFLS